MTSTTDIEQDLEDLGADVLEDLDPDERATLAVKLAAAGGFDQVEVVKQAAPMKSYEARDLTFSDKLTDNIVMALYAMWELETGVWRFFYERARGQLEESNYRQYPDEEWTTEPSPDNGFHEQPAMDAAAGFFGNYLAWERYAEKQVGVSLETFLSHPFTGGAGPKVSVIVFTAKLVTGRGLEEAESDNSWAAEGTVTVDGKALAAEDLAEVKYQQLTSAGERGLL